jgi:hypothetical protein
MSRTITFLPSNSVIRSKHDQRRFLRADDRFDYSIQLQIYEKNTAGRAQKRGPGIDAESLIA